MANYVEKFRPGVIERGPRLVQTGQYLDYALRVVSGYDVVNDRFPVHAYVQKGKGEKIKIDTQDIQGRSEHEAFELGFRAIDKWISRQQAS